jgi:2-C-methyl-D-erythritol 4-phosphate cytidylyltransferase
MAVTAIIAAGGRGERLGAGQPKQFLSIAGDHPRTQRSGIFTHAAVDDLVVALPAEPARASPPT